MATNITMTYGIVAYYLLLAIVIMLFSMGGAFDNQEVITTTPDISQELTSQINQSELPDSFVESFGIGKTIKNLFSFFVFNISITTKGVMDFLWLVRIIFVYFPALLLTITILFFTRGTT